MKVYVLRPIMRFYDTKLKAWRKPNHNGSEDFTEHEERALQIINARPKMVEIVKVEDDGKPQIQKTGEEKPKQRRPRKKSRKASV